MGKASHDGGSQDIRITTSSSNPMNVSHTPNGHESRPNQVSNFSSNASNLSASNIQGFQKSHSSKFFDTQSLNSGKNGHLQKFVTQLYLKTTSHNVDKC